MKNRNIWKEIGDFVLGKGFYMVLALSLITVGVSGYYLYRGMNPGNPSAHVTGSDTVVTLPDPQPAPEPVESALPELPELGQIPVETVKPTQPEQPEPEQKEEDKSQEQPQPEKPKARVFTWPVKGEVLRAFSVDTLTLDPTLGDWRTHAGVDIAAPVGTRVLAMSAGTVLEIREDDLMGKCVIVDHGEGLLSTYCNLAQEVTVKEGETVTTGTILGTVGESAIAERETPAHLHLETCLDGDAVDPAGYLPDRP